MSKDTDVLVILLHQWNPGSGDIFRCERQETKKTKQKKLKQHTPRRTRQLRLVFEERNQSCGGVSKELQSPRGTTLIYMIMHFWDAIRLLLSIGKVWYGFSNTVRKFRAKNILQILFTLEETRNLISAIYGLCSQPRNLFREFRFL